MRPVTDLRRRARPFEVISPYTPGGDQPAAIDELERRLLPDGLAVVMKADHFCMHWRGVKDESQMTSSVMRGAFLRNASLRREFLGLI